MKAAIIEDEANAAQRLRALIGEIAPDIEIVVSLETVEASVAWLSRNSPDVIFLDIHLGDGSSFRIFDYVVPDALIIFTTAYDEYAIKAFKLNSIDYLLKPINKLDLAAAIDKLRRFGRGESATDPDKLRNLAAPPAEYKKRFLIQIGSKIRTVDVAEVAYFYALEKNVFFMTRDKKQHPADHTISALEEMLDPARFFRINRKFIIAVDAIRSMTAYSRGRIKIELEPPPPEQLEAIVSIDRADDFRVWLGG